MTTFYLIGGGEFDEDVNVKVEKRVLQGIDNPSVLIIPWSSDNPSILKKYRRILLDFFKKLGSNEVHFLEIEDSPAEIRKKITESNIIYLPGGKTEILLKNIKAKNITSFLKDFKGIVMGISAGAYVLSKAYIKSRNGDLFFIPTLNLIDVYIKTHYKSEMDPILLRLSKKYDIYGITDNSALVWQKGNLREIIGEVYLFRKGQKNRLVI